MVRSEDPPGVDKHLRFGKIVPDLLETLKTFPGVRAVVLHTHGKTGEHPHYHVFWTGEKPVTNQTVRNRLKAFNNLFLGYAGQNDWSIRNHDNYSNWVTYVTNNETSQQLLTDDKFDEIFENIPKLPIVIDSPLRNNPPAALPTTTISIPRKKQLTSEEKLIAFITRESHWKLNSEWTIGKVEYLAQTPDAAYRRYSEICAEKIVHYTMGRVYHNQHISLTRNLMYLFADDDLRESLALRLAAKIKSADIV